MSVALLWSSPTLPSDAQFSIVIELLASLLAGNCSYNFLFSPSFEYYLDANYQGNEFIIRDVERNGKIQHVIPKGLMSLSFKGYSKSEKAIPCLAKLMSFYDDSHLRIINKGGVDWGPAGLVVPCSQVILSLHPVSRGVCTDGRIRSK